MALLRSPKLVDGLVCHSNIGVTLYTIWLSAVNITNVNSLLTFYNKDNVKYSSHELVFKEALEVATVGKKCVKDRCVFIYLRNLKWDNNKAVILIYPQGM